MFNTYADIFNKRGVAYHEAMRRYPVARDEEFSAMIRLMEPQKGQIIVDMPSGGGYLRRYLGANSVQLVAIETTEAFYSQCEEDEHTKSMLCNLNDTKLPSASVDTVVSMAGLHHVEDRSAVFQEVHRILKPGGTFCAADVESGSVIDGFLDTFVNQHNSMGHEGKFIDSHFREALRGASFNIELDELVEYPWKFTSVEQMVDYCILMFGLDAATPEEVRNGIAAYQGYKNDEQKCDMNWQLRFIRCRK